MLLCLPFKIWCAGSLPAADSSDTVEEYYQITSLVRLWRHILWVHAVHWLWCASECVGWCESRFSSGIIKHLSCATFCHWMGENCSQRTAACSSTNYPPVPEPRVSPTVMQVSWKIASGVRDAEGPTLSMFGLTWCLVFLWSHECPFYTRCVHPIARKVGARKIYEKMWRHSVRTSSVILSWN